ncbi:MAG: hypothetical protein ACPG5U_03055 [Planktomarina sp.]
MALPIAPFAGIALRYGGVAAATFVATRAIPRMRRNQKTEDVLDTVEEGFEFRRDPEQITGTGRYRRTIQIGRNGPKIELDIASLTRIRFRRLR